MRLLVCLLAAAACAATPNAPFYSVKAGALFNATTSDAAGNVYIAGGATSRRFPATPRAYQTKDDKGVCFRNTCSDAFVMKLDPMGNVVFATQLAGSGADSAGAIALDSAGNIYVTGQTGHIVGQVNDFPITKNALFPHTGPDAVPPGTDLSFDGFLAIFNPDGSQLLYSTYLPSLSNVALTLDPDDNIYIAGIPANPATETIKATPGAFQTRPSYGLLLKISPGGSSLAYATYFDSAVGPGAIAADASGNLYITGFASSPLPVTPGAFQTQFPASLTSTGFVAKLNPSGTGLVYATYLGGSSLIPGVFGACNLPTAIRLASNGDVWVSGTTCTGDFPTTAGALPIPSDALVASSFLTRLNSEGTALVFSTLVPNSTSSEFGGLALNTDASGNVYLVTPAAFGFPVTPGAFQICRGGLFDLGVLQFGPSGQLNGATYLSGVNTVGSIVAVGDGSVFVTGETDVYHFLINDPQRKNGACLTPEVQNAANLSELSPIAPGEVIQLDGYGLGPQTPVSYQLGPDGKVPTELAGVQVLIDGQPSPILSVQSQQISAIVPWQLSNAGSLSVVVELNGTTLANFQCAAGDYDPAIFVTNTRLGEAAILNEDGTPNSASNPAKPGSVIAMWGTGGGLMTSIPQDGSFTPLLPPYPLLTMPLHVSVGGYFATVLYAGAAPTLVAGVIQINALLPAQAHGANVASLTIDNSFPGQNNRYAVVWIE